MKTLTWVDTTRKAIKSKLGFAYSVQKNDKELIIFFIQRNDEKNSFLVDI